MGPTDTIKDDVYTCSGEAANLFHKIDLPVVNWDPAQSRNRRRIFQRASTVHMEPGKVPKLHQCRSDPACCAVHQHALALPDFSGAMEHLICGNVVQHEADSLSGVQSGRHGNQFTRRQADELGVRAGDRQRRYHLIRLDSGNTVTDSLDQSNQIPPRSEGKRRRFGMKTLAHHQVGLTDTCRQHSHPHLTILRLRALFLHYLKCIRPAVMSDYDARVSHGFGKTRPLQGIVAD